MKWSVSNIDDATYLGPIEFNEAGEWHMFEVLETEDRLVFGGMTNTGFIESGYILKEDFFSTDETLQEMLADLEVYYRDGKEYVGYIVCNDRM